MNAAWTLRPDQGGAYTRRPAPDGHQRANLRSGPPSRVALVNVIELAVRRPSLPPPPRSDERRSDLAWARWLLEAWSTSPDRLRHSLTLWWRAIAAVKDQLSWLSTARAEPLVLAALLHDIGRLVAPDADEPHGFAGAAWLDSLGLHEVAPLVAHHSGGSFAARLQGLGHLDRWQPDGDLLGVLTYLDRTTSATGDVVSVRERRGRIVERYGPASTHLVAFDLATPQAARGRRLLFG